MRDHTRDYCFAAFRFWARWGGKENFVNQKLADLRLQKGTGICSSTESIAVKRDQIMRELQAEIDDLEAVEKVVNACRQNYPEIWQALNTVYFYKPYEDFDWGEIVQQVHFASLQIPASERQVYRWLRQARMLFAEERGLRLYGEPKREKAVV